MKAMFLSDMLIAKKYLPSQIGIGFAVAAFMAVFMGNIYVVVPALCVMIPFSLMFTILTFDERNGWEQLRLSMPLSRPDVSLGRYASLAALAAIGLASSLAALALLAVAALLLPGIPQLADLLVEFSWQPFFLSSCAGIGMLFAMLTIVLPLVAWLGMTKTVRVVPMLIVLGLAGLFIAGGNLPGVQMAENLVSLVKTPGGTLAAGLAVLAACAIAYVLSALLSVRLYEKREF